MKDSECVAFLQWALPQMRMRWPGFRRVRRQVCKRIDRRMRELGLFNAAAYRDYLSTHPTEWNVLDSFCRISISRFYRDRGVFDFLRCEVLPELAAGLQDGVDRTVRCWSAGCASGEEVYTLRIAWKLDVGLRFPGVRMQILATDSDPRMLDRARLGCYSMSSLKDLPPEWLSRAFTESDGLHYVRPEFREGIEFALQDIRRRMPAGQFQLLLCRHVAFTYFDEPLQLSILDQLLSRLVPGGFLVTGKQEPLPIVPAELEECRPKMGVYRKRTGERDLAGP